VESPRTEVGDSRLPKEITQCRHWEVEMLGNLKEHDRISSELKERENRGEISGRRPGPSLLCIGVIQGVSKAH
jgi:hypothetical protein